MLSPTFFDEFFLPRSSIFVVSDSQLAAWKREKAEAEIIELDKLIDSHEASIARLKETREQLRKDYPVLTETTEE